MSRIAIFPGSFDPFTIGHKAIVDSALPLFDKIFIAIGENSNKNDFISLESRLKHISGLYVGSSVVSVVSYSGLTIEFCKKNNVSFILRGLRNTSDFQYEKSIAQVNKELYPGVETVFIIPPPQLGHISSTIVRDIIKHKGDISRFVPGTLDI